ncbi:Glutamate receptor 1 [Trachymyrmex zeteki]|uniref:Glutamate receptor 1 n=1 Tax=Mycetomoellerius zeteki TaxID=64791 RepID=A0A151XFN3_9HYME|nr:Glutamate receptor 1 [Trachymyrmex zeteki]
MERCNYTDLVCSRCLSRRWLVSLRRAIFEQGTDEVQNAFKFAMMSHNQNITTRKFELQAFVDVINTADAYKLSRLSESLYRFTCLMNILISAYKREQLFVELSAKTLNVSENGALSKQINAKCSFVHSRYNEIRLAGIEAILFLSSLESSDTRCKRSASKASETKGSIGTAS